MKHLSKLLGPLCLALMMALSAAGRLSPVALERKAPDTIEAEIKGEVKNPDLYTIKNGATIKDLIETAGGQTEAADLSAIALGREVRAHEVIVIGKQKEQGDLPFVSLNSATLEELMTLPGIGESTAQKILDYRSEKSFAAIEDLMNVPGIGEKKFEKLKERICL